MEFTTLIYILIGGFLLFLLLIFFIFQLLGNLLLGKKTTPIDEEQKQLCHEAIHDGRAGSIACRFYVFKGYCPHGDCNLLKQKTKK